MESVFVSERFSKAAFVPKVGDTVEFHSDRQTEKGPSGGSVIAVDRETQTAVIRHSDHPGETFKWGDVKVEYVHFKEPGKTFWLLT